MAAGSWYDDQVASRVTLDLAVSVSELPHHNLSQIIYPASAARIRAQLRVPL
jgi:hypothetical protein